jgi:hypothetical protein
MPRTKLIHEINSITSTTHIQTVSHTSICVINNKLGVFVERAIETARLASKPVANTEVASVIKGIQRAVNKHLTPSHPQAT